MTTAKIKIRNIFKCLQFLKLFLFTLHIYYFYHNLMDGDLLVLKVILHIFRTQLCRDI